MTVVVFWLAHVYAHALAWSLDANETFSRRGLRPIARKEWPLLQAAVVPSFALLAGGIGLIATQTAYWIAIGYGVVMLISWGLVFARQERLSPIATCAVVFANALFGLAIVLLKEFVNHRQRLRPARSASIGQPDGVHLPGAGYALQLVLPAVLEDETRADREILDGAGDDDLACARLTFEPRRDVDGEPGEIAAVDLDLSGVHAGPDLEAQGTHGIARREGAADGLCG